MRKQRHVGSNGTATARTCQDRGADGDARAVYAATQAELAWVFDVSLSAVRLWAAQGAPPKGGRGYNLREWVMWRLARQAAPAIQPEGQTAAEADRRYKLARAAREEIRLRRDQGVVVDVDEARSKREGIIRWFLAAFEQIGPQLQITLAPQIGLKAARTVRQAAEEHVRQLRQAGFAGHSQQ